MAMNVLFNEGMSNNRTGIPNFELPNGHTHAEAARMLGFAQASIATTLKQLQAGVPVDKVISSGGGTNSDQSGYAKIHNNISDHGTRKPPGHVRISKGPNDLVRSTITMYRWAADDITEIARRANVTKVEILRQAVEEYLQRYRDEHADHPVKRSYPKK